MYSTAQCMALYGHIHTQSIIFPLNIKSLFRKFYMIQIFFQTEVVMVNVFLLVSVAFALIKSSTWNMNDIQIRCTKDNYGNEKSTGLNHKLQSFVSFTHLWIWELIFIFRIPSPKLTPDYSC